MANDALITTSGSGSQATTQSPQSAGQPANTGAQASSVQPGTATALLSNSQGGVALRPTALSTVSLAGATTSTLAAKPVSVPKHHANPVIFGFSALLLVVAAVLFWTTSRSVKNTTHY